MGKCLIKCPHCGHQASAKEELIGKKTKCPECQRIFIIECADIPDEKINAVQEKNEDNGEEDHYIVGVCPSCTKEIQLQRNQLGTEVECPYCRETVVVETEKIIEHRCPFCGQIIKEGAEVCKYCHKSINLLTVAIAWGKPAVLCGIGFTLLWILDNILPYVMYLTRDLSISAFKRVILLRTIKLIAFVLIAGIVYGLAGKFKPGLHFESPVLRAKAWLIIFLSVLIPGCLVTFFFPGMGYLIIFLMVFALTAENVYLPVIGRYDSELLKQWTTSGNQSQPPSENQAQVSVKEPEALSAGDAEQNKVEVPTPLKSHCPYCGASFDIQQEWIGQNAECPQCHKEFQI